MKNKDIIYNLEYVAAPLLVEFSVSDTQHHSGNYVDGFEYASFGWSEFHRVTKKFAYSSSFFRFGHRSNDNVEGFGNLLIYDIDDGLSMKEAKKILDGFRVLMVTTKSHQVDKNGAICDRYRLIFPIKKVIAKIEPELHKELLLTVLRYIGFPVDKVDRQALGSSYAFRPAHNQLHKYFEGEMIDVDALIPLANTNLSKMRDQEALERSERVKQYADKDFDATTLNDASEALYRLDPDMDNDEWVKTGAALRNEFGDSAFELFDSWSSRGKKYNSKEMMKRWNTFNLPKITIASLFYMAKGA